EPIEKNYGPSQKFLRAHPHDICLVTDGDADRVGGMDGRGNALTTHQIICLLLHHLIVNRRSSRRESALTSAEKKLSGLTSAATGMRVVKALTTTSMVDKMCATYGL